MKILIILFFLHFISFAQIISIEGYVKDSETNKPLINANVYISTQEGVGVTTNAQGLFNFKNVVQASDTLFISYVGYETQRIQISELSGIQSVPN